MSENTEPLGPDSLFALARWNKAFIWCHVGTLHCPSGHSKRDVVVLPGTPDLKGHPLVIPLWEQSQRLLRETAATIISVTWHRWQGHGGSPALFWYSCGKYENILLHVLSEDSLHPIQLIPIHIAHLMQSTTWLGKFLFRIMYWCKLTRNT